MVQCLVGLGSNLGESRKLLDLAVSNLSEAFEVIAASEWHSYPSVGPAADGLDSQPDFLNGVVLLDSTLPPQETADVLHRIEQSAGRNRLIRWSSRTLDADLLTYGDRVVETPDLQVPHPRMVSRRFVLEPACEIAAEAIHPVVGWSIKRLFEHLCDAKPYFAIIGSNTEEASKLARQLANKTHGRFSTVARAMASSDRETFVQSMKEKLTALSAEASGEFRGPWFSDFWIGEISEQMGSKASPDWNPKLILTTDSMHSEFGYWLTDTLKRSHPKLRVPVIHLSPDKKDAWQDALGAVEGMQ